MRFALPTTASLDRFGSYFRLTHRFARDLRGPIGELAKSANPGGVVHGQLVRQGS